MCAISDDQRRLAGAADAQVADADDRALQPAARLGWRSNQRRRAPPPARREGQAMGLNGRTLEGRGVAAPAAAPRDTASDLSFAPRLASTSARAAAPRRARRIGSVISATSTSPSSRSLLTCDAGDVGHEGVGDLGEVLHVRAEHDRFAKHRRLEDVVPAGRPPGFRRRTPPSPVDRSSPARRCCRA